MLEVINVLVATAMAFALGAVWYGMLAKPWVALSGVAVDEDGKPANASHKSLFAVAFVLQLVVAGMMRHVFAFSGIETIGAALMSGIGIGLFFITPWIALNNNYAGRSPVLSLIDGGYATLACATMAAVLVLF